MNNYPRIFGVIALAVLVYLAMRPQSIGINRPPVCEYDPLGIKVNCSDETQYPCNKEYCDFVSQKFKFTHKVEGKAVRLQWDKLDPQKYLQSNPTFYLTVRQVDGKFAPVTATQKTEYLHENPPCGYDLMYVLLVTTPERNDLYLPALMVKWIHVKQVC